MQILLEHGNGEVREAFCNLLKAILKSASQTEQERHLVHHLCSLFEEAVGVHCKRNDEYFEVLRELLNMQGPRAITILREANFVTKLLQHISCEE